MMMCDVKGVEATEQPTDPTADSLIKALCESKSWDAGTKAQDELSAFVEANLRYPFTFDQKRMLLEAFRSNNQLFASQDGREEMQKLFVKSSLSSRPIWPDGMIFLFEAGAQA
jgi:hypothetical protein